MNCMHYKWHNYECYSYNRLIQRYAQDHCFVKWYALSSGINHCIIVYTNEKGAKRRYNIISTIIFL